MVIEAQVVYVTAHEVVIPVFKQPFSLFFGVLAVASGNGAEVELEQQPELLQFLIVRLLHVFVAFGVRENGAQAGVEHFSYQSAHFYRRAEIACLNKRMVVAEHQNVALTPAFGKDAVHHVLGCEMQADRSVVCGGKLLEALLERADGVWHVLHNVGREPHVGNTGLLHCAERFQSEVGCLESIVDTGQQVAVVVGESVKQAAFEY